MTFCAGAGILGSSRGADQNTGAFAFMIAGGATVATYPATLTSPDDPLAVYFATTYFQDTALLYQSTNSRWWTCINSTALCGPTHTTCEDISIVTNGLPSSILLLGMEGGGNPAASCQGSDMIVYPPDFTGPGPCANDDLAVTITAPVTKVYTGYANAPSCAQVTANVTGGTGSYTLIWDDGNGNGNNSPSPNFCPTTTTTYTVTVNDSQCGFVATASVTIEVEDVSCGRRNNCFF
ncbi:MAG: hypothetical protein AAFO94_23085, partial [Bacteroidota bacterium]